MIVHVESSFNAAYLVNSFKKESYLTFVDGGCGLLRENLFNPESNLYKSQPDILLLLLWHDFFEISKKLTSEPLSIPLKDANIALNNELDNFERLVKDSLRSLPGTRCIVVAPPIPYDSSLRLLEGNIENYMVVEFLERLNHSLSQRFKKYNAIYFYSLDRIFRRFGWESMTDKRVEYLTKSPFSKSGVFQTSRVLLKIITSLITPPCKVIVCDLDNTLWSGVLGEGAVNMAPDGPSKAFNDFQIELKSLRALGFLLAIVSKNNEKDAISVLENHPDQILRLSSFSAYRINWRDKATNIQEIAIGLGLGLDSFVFIDDNPVERAWVREALPEVKVVSVPDDPTHYVQCIRDIASLWQFRLTKEDLGRVSSYQQDKKRQSLKDRTKSYEEYLASLNMAVQIQPINDETLPRTVQLVNKTNQFNLTTRRYSEADIVKMTRGTDNWLVISLHMTDVFQDYGQVGCAILSRDKDCVIIDVLLLSCRVLGRTIESVFLSAIIETSKKWGAKEVNGIFVPSHKNQQTEFFYPSHDFQKKISTGSSDQFIWKISTSYSLPLKSKISLELSLNKIHNATNLNKKQGENNDYN